ncbi:hypothetical protein PoB_002026500 [Plakobranchus ocellatus]|uniref:Uncharacterized protein n=1 Tax=Plakobranchus ocellatus TaxID=259542 RepID=A0AAV3ZGT2_9GAST|nr:hypothetical protein PoB_002026500 [Plakobranchus ocellatus]
MKSTVQWANENEIMKEKEKREGDQNFHIQVQRPKVQRSSPQFTQENNADSGQWLLGVLTIGSDQTMSVSQQFSSYSSYPTTSSPLAPSQVGYAFDMEWSS